MVDQGQKWELVWIQDSEFEWWQRTNTKIVNLKSRYGLLHVSAVRWMLDWFDSKDGVGEHVALHVNGFGSLLKAERIRPCVTDELGCILLKEQHRSRKVMVHWSAEGS